MMLYFLIPLRSERVTPDWDATSRLLEQTLHSACSQTADEFQVILVCHERPRGIAIPRQCRIVDAPFDPPDLPLNELTSRESLHLLRTDKGRKQLCALNEVRSDPDSHVMFLDADDLVSNRLASFVLAHPRANGWYFDGGYRLDTATPLLVFSRRRFNEECGSSHILRTELAPFPDILNYTKDFDDYYVKRYVAHAYLRERMADLGHPLDPLPFRGAIYVFNGHNLYASHGRARDSVFRTVGRILIKGRPFLGKRRAEFIPTIRE